MASDAPKPLDPNSLARRLGAAVCLGGVFLLLMASVLEPNFHVDVTLVVVLLIGGAGLLGVELKIWGP